MLFLSKRIIFVCDDDEVDNMSIYVTQILTQIQQKKNKGNRQ